MNKYHEKHKNDEDYKARNAIRAKLWYEKNREKALARINAQAKLKKSQKAEYDKQYYLKNKEKKRLYYEEWYAKDPSKAIDNVRSWRKEHPVEHSLHNGARRAKTNGVKIVKEEIHNWESRVCPLCNKIIEDKHHIDHIVPLSMGGKHEVTNLQLTHPVCNLRKHNKLANSIL